MTIKFFFVIKIVEVLVRLAPDHPTVIISTSEELKDVIVGIVYVPKEVNPNHKYNNAPSLFSCYHCY